MACSLHPANSMFALIRTRRSTRISPRMSATPALLLAGLLVVLTAAPVAAAEDAERSGRENAFGVEVASRGLWKEAAYRWEKAIELDPVNPKAFNNLAVAYERSGQFEEALDAYETALELLPTSEFIRQNYELFREAYERKKRKDRDARRSDGR